MCRFLAYHGEDRLLSSLLTEPEHSLIHQSHSSKHRNVPINGDGFGVAWYNREHREEPGRIRSLQPAWSNQNLQQLCRVTTSPIVFAHVRAATPGLGVTEPNCHPFTYGPYAFMHNGSVANFRSVRRSLQKALSDEAYDMILGTTDSELLFGLFIDCMAEQPDGSSGSIREALGATVAKVERISGQQCRLNLAVTDGVSMTVCRYASDGASCPSLFMREEEHGVVVASEPIKDGSRWREVPVQHVVSVGEQRDVVVDAL